MNRLACIDLDGVVSDSTARFAKAEEAKQQYIETMSNDLYQASMRDATSLFWQTAFSPDLVPLDVLIDGTWGYIKQIEQNGYEVVFLTSRPETMQEATVTWLNLYDLDTYTLVMKPASKQFTKTTVWKSDEIQRLAKERNAEIVLVVDDEHVNLAEISKYASAFNLLYLAKSLEAATTLIS